MLHVNQKRSDEQSNMPPECNMPRNATGTEVDATNMAKESCTESSTDGIVPDVIV